MRYFERIKRDRKIRRLLAAMLLAVAFFDIAGHAIVDAQNADGSSAQWCVKYHYTNSGVDCPHKRDHRGPERSAFDDSSHVAVLAAEELIEGSGISYRSEPPARRETRVITRSLTPPFHPPEQV